MTEGSFGDNFASPAKSLIVKEIFPTSSEVGLVVD
jgi:hypothetical protein